MFELFLCSINDKTNNIFDDVCVILSTSVIYFRDMMAQCQIPPPAFIAQRELAEMAFWLHYV